MSDNQDNQNRQEEDPIDWGALFRRKDRPLPKRGCSWAFYLFMLLLLVFLVIMFVQYSHLPK